MGHFKWSPNVSLIELEMCQLINTCKKLTFDELMPETDKLKKNKKGRGRSFAVFLMMFYLKVEKEDPKIGVEN